MSSRVFVGGLSYRVAEHDIHKFFQKYGRVKEVSMKSGFAFVEFDDHRDADDAVYELNGKHLMGERVVVEHAHGTDRRASYRDRDRDRDLRYSSSYSSSRISSRSRSSYYKDYDRDIRGGNSDRYGPPTRTDHRLIVENLSSRVSWQDLKDYMRQAGEVTYADAHKDRKNEGVVEFASSSDMRNAVSKLDDTELNGRRIRLIEDRRSSRRRSRSSSSRSRSRSRRRSRSRSSRSSRSKSHARSKSPSRSKSRGHSKSKSKSRSRSRSKSEIKKSRSKSRSQSVSKGKPTKQASRSPSKEKSKSRSRSPQKNGDCSDNNDD